MFGLVAQHLKPSVNIPLHIVCVGFRVPFGLAFNRHGRSMGCSRQEPPSSGISATANRWKREGGGRLLILALLPSFLPVLGLSVFLLTLDREPDTGALQPAAVAYGVPASFAGR